MSLTQVKREPLEVVVNNQRYILPTLNLAGMRRLQAWLDRRPSPVDLALGYAKGWPEDMKAQALAEAKASMAAWPPKLGHPSASEHLQSMDGIFFVAGAMLKQGQPGLDDNAIADVVGSLALDDVPGLLAHALGIDLDGEGDGDPKAGETPA